MRNNRKLKIKTDLENLHMLHRLNRIYNSPKTLHGPRYYPQKNSDNKRFNNFTRTIVLQKTTPMAYYPVKVKLIKNNRNDYSYSPEGRSFRSPSYSRYNNNSFINNSLNKEKNNINIEYDISKNRNYKDINNNQIENLKYKNLGQINKLKISLGNPKDARNIMINNNDRNNRFISVSPSQNSNKDDIRDKNNDYLRFNDINIENNYDGKHQIRYLLSKEYLDKIKNINKIQNYNNNYRPNNNNYYNNRSYSNRYFQKKSEDYYLNKYNMESSPGNKSSNTETNQYKAKPGNNLINNIQVKKETPNITPIINDNTPYMLPQDKIIEEEIELNNYNNYSNPNNIFLNNNPNYIYKIVEIKLDDLIFIEGRFNDIILSLNNNKNIFDIGAINEAVEFFVFYFHSSLKNKLSLFFSEPNRIIIKSAFNLNLYIIMITYHLSLNPSMLVKVILLLRQIYNYLKKNLFLIIRKIELYYGDDFCRKNEIYFKTCNYFLSENGLDNINESEIISIISRNCVSIVNDIKNILNYYQTINNRYYNDFKDIFLNISRLGEQDLNNYFYNYLFNSSKKNIITQQRINNRNEYSVDNVENSNFIEANANNNFFNNNSYYNNISNNNINNNYLRASQNESVNKEQEEDDEQFLDEIILSYKKNKEIPPFLKYKNQKKYTLVLDLEDTLISVKLINDGKILIRPRPGLISFLTGVKPYYEIISFSKLSRNYSSIIIDQIEENRKLFDYNLYREHCSLIGRKFVKDISRIGRDMKKIIMVDDLPENLNIHVDNGILILPYDGDENKEDRVLYELKKILILFYNLGYEDLRNAIKSYKNEIYQKITLGLTE